MKVRERRGVEFGGICFSAGGNSNVEEGLKEDGGALNTLGG